MAPRVFVELVGEREERGRERARVLLRGGGGWRGCENTRVRASSWECLGEWRSGDARAGSGRVGARAARTPVRPPAGFRFRGASGRRAFRIECSLPRRGVGRGAGPGAPWLGRGERGGARRPLHGEKGERRAAGTSARLAGRVAGTDWPSAPDASAGQGGWRLPFPSRPME